MRHSNTNYSTHAHWHKALTHHPSRKQHSIYIMMIIPRHNYSQSHIKYTIAATDTRGDRNIQKSADHSKSHTITTIHAMQGIHAYEPFSSGSSRSILEEGAANGWAFAAQDPANGGEYVRQAWHSSFIQKDWFWDRFPKIRSAFILRPVRSGELLTYWDSDQTK